MELIPERLINPFGRRVTKLDSTSLTVLQKTWLVSEVKHFGVSYRFLTDKYRHPESYLKGLVFKFKKKNRLYESRGRPDILGPSELEKVKAQVSSGIHNMNIEEFGKILQAELVSKVTNETGVAQCSIRTISRRTTARKIEKMNLRLGYAEQTTDARAVATANKYNAVSVAVAHHLMMPLTNAHITINADGTSYQTGGALTDKIRVIYDIEEQKARGGPLKVLPVKGSSLTAYFMKFYLCMNATGMTAPPIYICADDNMEAGVIDVHEVAGLGIGTEVTSIGYVVFAKTRSVNEEFYKWWFTNIYVRFVTDLRIRYSIEDSVPSYFTLDGEDTQIKPLQTAQMAAMCAEQNIVIGKPPASTTSITQPCDAGKCFLSSKTKKRNMKSIADVLEKTMSDRLRAMIASHEAIVGSKMPCHHVKSCIEGLQVVQYMLQTTLRRDMVAESFKITGQYDPALGGCNVEQILGQCKEPFKTHEVAKVWKCMPQLCALMKENGELKEKDYEILGFDEGGQYTGDRDNLVLNRRRYVFLTNPAVIASEDAKRIAKITAADLKKNNSLKRKEAAAVRLAAGVVPKKRARKTAAVESDAVPLI